MSKSFKTDLNPSSQIFVELKSREYPWWDNLKKKEGISIQIRQGNTIDVYHNGGAILSSLKYDGNEFKARIHSKYIPLENDTVYQSLKLTPDGVKFSKEIKLMELSQFEDERLKTVMSRVKAHYDNESEKAIQFEFIANDPFIIDAELQTTENGRIDLVRLDKSVQKIVLIEVKTMGDSRLFAESQKDKENIHDQLKKYHEFAVNNQKSILDHYVKVLQVKNDLGLIRPEVKGLKISDWEVECKPLLVFGDCKSAWTKNNADEINKKIKTVAYGAYYFGDTKYTLELDPKSKKSRYYF